MHQKITKVIWAMMLWADLKILSGQKQPEKDAKDFLAKMKSLPGPLAKQLVLHNGCGRSV